ncbi:MAG: TRAP transporter small permease [Spirochaetes bacterium]|nr:TRAP transporter small permease [Spirochaetota bacterium]
MSETQRRKDEVRQEETEFRYSDLKWEDWVVLTLFWALAFVVFLQFFSRYVLNAAIVWTEEMARYLLIAVGFLGSAIAARKGAHIFMEFSYRFLPPKLGFIMSTMVDIIKIVFFGMCTYLSIKIMPIMARQRMVTVHFSMAVLYGSVLIGFILMTFRSIQTAWIHWKKKYIPVINDKV